MISNSMLYLTSLSQWGLFLGIGFILFGWIEKRQQLTLAGQLTFLLLGLLTAWVLLTGQIPEPAAMGETISKEVRVLAYFKALAWFSGWNVVSLLLKLFKLRFHNISLYLLVFFALMLFFMIFNIQKYSII